MEKNCHFKIAKQNVNVSNRFNPNPVAIYKKTLEFDDRKRKHDLHVIWNAISYLIKTGCQWRMLPSDFPNWQLVYYYYSKWSDLEIFDLLLS